MLRLASKLIACIAFLLIAFVITNHLRNTEDSSPLSQPRPEVAKLAIVEPADVVNFPEWQAAYRNAPETSRPIMLHSGIASAKARAERIKQLIQSDPAAALEEVLSLSEYAQLPEQLLPYFEKTVSGYGDIDLRWATHVSAEGAKQCSHENRLYLNDTSYTLYGAGRRDAQSPALDLPVVAYVLDDIALIPESSVLPVEGDDLLAAQQLFESAEQGGVDPVTQQPINPEVAAVIGGKLYYFASEGIRDQVAEQIELAELATLQSKSHTVQLPFTWLAGDTGDGQQGITQSSFFADDDITVLFIRCDFSDFDGAPVTKANLETDLATISGHFNTMSYQTAFGTTTVTTTLYRATGTGTSYAQSGDDDALYDDVVAKYDAAPDASTSSAYDVVAIYFPDLGGVANSQITYGGLASVGGSRHWINGITSSHGRIEVITHEFGHNYGLYHSNYWHPEQQLGGSYYDPSASSLEYGDIFDNMGNGDLPEAHFNHYQKHKINWLTDDKVQEVTTSGLYKVYRFDHIDADDNPLLALRVPMQDNVFYWVGNRKLYTSNTNLNNGAYVVAEGFYNEGPNLIDMTPESEISESSDRYDAGLPVGSSFVDAAAGVTFTTVASGMDGTNDEWITVQIDFESRIGFAQYAYEVDERAGTITLTVQRLYSSDGAASVDFATSDGSATVGSDYYATSGTLTWADGDSSERTISISIKPDSAVEGIEDFSVTLSNPVSGVLDSGRTTQVVSILDPGQRYASFTPAFFNYTVNAISFQSDDRAIIAGVISHNSGDFLGAGNIARLNSLGDVDPDFNAGGSGFDGEVDQIIIQPDDYILVRGSFTQYNGTLVDDIVRLGPDGALDTIFETNLGTGANGSVYALALEANGEILIGGSFTDFNGTTTEGLIRLNATGTVDDSLALPFNVISTTRIRDILVQPDGKIIVVGLLRLVDWTGSGWRSGVARLNTDGTRDITFDPDAGLHVAGSRTTRSTGYTIDQLPGGDYLISGFFSAYDENLVDNFVRINADGTFDRAFGTAFDSYTPAMLIEPFGAALLGGYFNTPVTNFIRIKEDWTEDADFQSSGGPDVPDDSGGSVYALAHAPDGSFWLGGNFYTYNGSSSRPIVRLASGVSPYNFWAQENFTPAQIDDGDADPDFDADGDDIVNLGEMALGTNPNVADASSVFGSGNLSGLSLVDVAGNDYLQMTLDKSALTGGVWYCVQLSSDLSTWTPNPAVPGDETAFEILEDSDSRLVIRDKTPISTGTPRFARIVLKTPE